MQASPSRWSCCARDDFGGFLGLINVSFDDSWDNDEDWVKVDGKFEQGFRLSLKQLPYTFDILKSLISLIRIFFLSPKLKPPPRVQSIFTGSHRHRQLTRIKTINYPCSTIRVAV